MDFLASPRMTSAIVFHSSLNAAGAEPCGSIQHFLNDQVSSLRQDGSSNTAAESEAPASPIGPIQEYLLRASTSVKGRKLIELPLAAKKEILDLVSDGELSFRELGRQFGVSSSTVGNIARSRAQILSLWESGGGQDSSALSKTVRRSPNEDLNARVLEFVRSCQAQEIKVTGPMIKCAARSIARKLDVAECFSASNGWLECFRSRNNIEFRRKRKGESNQVELCNLASAADAILADVLSRCDPGSVVSRVPVPAPGHPERSRDLVGNRPRTTELLSTSGRQLPSYEEAVGLIGVLRSYSFAQQDLGLVQQVCKLETDIRQKHLAKWNKKAKSKRQNIP